MMDAGEIKNWLSSLMTRETGELVQPKMIALAGVVMTLEARVAELEAAVDALSQAAGLVKVTDEPEETPKSKSKKG